LRSHSSGVRELIASKSSMESSTPISRATASRCSTALVEPPEQATAAIALARLSRVMTWLGRMPRLRASTPRRPASTATSALSPCSAGTMDEPIGEMPSTSNAIAIVLAVNWPPQAPAPGLATDSSSWSSSSVIRPVACAPTASKTSWIVTSRPSKRPGRIDPP
jgi:hypothetical protein